jgi:SAM-dependent methyltransferase
VCSEAIADLYEKHARDFDRDRGRALWEGAWLDRFLRYVVPAGTVLDIGCGMGEPIARYVIEAGFAAVGTDSSRSMIEMCRRRFPASEWFVTDMRRLALGRRFAGLLAWDSLFHLRHDDQRLMFPVFAAHALPGAPLLFTSGSAEGEAIGSYCGEPLYHASLAPAEYVRLLADNGFSVRAYRAEDPECESHTVWLATFGDRATARSTSCV